MVGQRAASRRVPGLLAESHRDQGRTELNELFRAATSEVAKIRKQETWSATSRHFQLRPLNRVLHLKGGDDPSTRGKRPSRRG
jgi:hypothetical protein